VNLMPGWMRTWHAYYNAQLDRMKLRRKRNMLWQLSRRRIIQVVVEVLTVTALMIFSRPLPGWLTNWLGPDWLFPNGPLVLFWVILTVVVLAPLVALWRNVSALSLLYAQVLVPRSSNASPRMRLVMELMLKIVAATVMFIWMSTLLPPAPGMRWLLLLSALVAAALLFALRRKLVYWHSEMESELQAMLSNPARLSVETTAPWLNAHGDWGIRATSCVLPDLALCQGKRISELDLRAQHGCMIAGIERQGVLIPHPRPDEVLYPRDKVLLIGTDEQVTAGKKVLTTVSGQAYAAEFDDVRVDSLHVPGESRAAGKDLRSLALAQSHRVQVIGIRRDNRRILNPGGDVMLMGGDELLVIGTPDELRAFNDWLVDTGEHGEG
jgi:CPA2 family monovalent cation:H+ antiporter-2